MSGPRVTFLLLWLGRQVTVSLLVMLGASFLLFAVVWSAPGSGSGAVSVGRTPVSGAFSERVGSTGDHLLARYGRWASGVVRGDFGISSAIQAGRPVSELLLPATLRSMALAAAGMALSVVGGLFLALFRTCRRDSPLGAIAEVGAHVLSTVPVFLFVYVFAIGGNGILAWGAREGYWHLPGWFPFPSSDAWAPWVAAAVILALGDGAFQDLYHRFRAELEQATAGGFLVGVRLLGMSVTVAVARGFLPGAASHVARRVGFVLGSLVVLESALGWPGLGLLAWRAAAERDLGVLLGVAVVLAVAVRLSVLLADGLWYAADPRKRTAA